jgi:hypothetical protein
MLKSKLLITFLLFAAFPGPSFAESCVDSVTPVAIKQDRIERKIRIAGDELTALFQSASSSKWKDICRLTRELVDLTNDWLSLEAEAGAICPGWIQFKNDRGTNKRSAMENALQVFVKNKSSCVRNGF